MEKQYYEHGQVKVTNARFIVQTQTYAVSGITSVRFDQNIPSWAPPVLLLLAGLFVVRQMAGSSATIWHWLFAVAPGTMWFLLRKPTYSVTLSTAAGESRALTSKNREFIRAVVEALNQAIIDRAGVTQSHQELAGHAIAAAGEKQSRYKFQRP